MDHSFVVSIARFHRTDPNRYVLQGYFTDNAIGTSRIHAVFGDRELPLEVGIRQGLAVRQKYFARGTGLENIDREYDFWITLPDGWQEAGRGSALKVYQTDAGRTRSLFRAGRDRLAKELGLLDGCLETFRTENGRIFIGGWAVGDGPCRFMAYDGKGNRLETEVTRHFRQDILDNYPEIEGPGPGSSGEGTRGQETSGAGTSGEGIRGQQTSGQKTPGGDEERSFGYEVSFEKPRADRIVLVVGTRSRKELYRLSAQRGIGRGMKVSALKKAAAYYRRYGAVRTAKRVGQKVHERMTGEREGYMSWRRHTLPSAEELGRQRAERFACMPLISIAVPLYRTDEKLLRALVDSVKKQTYENWELCLSDGSGENSPLTALLSELEAQDKRICVIDGGKALGISENTNQALSIAKGEFIAFADHDDLLPPWALYECVREINEHPQTRMIYSDEDKITMNGKEYFQPHFKSDFNMDLLTSMNYFCHLVVVSRELLMKVKRPGEEEQAWFDPAFDGAQDYDFVLRCVECVMRDEKAGGEEVSAAQCEGNAVGEEASATQCEGNAVGEEASAAQCEEKAKSDEDSGARTGSVCEVSRGIRHIPKVLYHWRSHPDSTSENPASKRYAFEAGQRALQAHFDRTGIAAKVSMGAYPGLYRVTYVIPDQEPLVSIIIPNKDHADDLRKCVSSILELSSYRNFEFIIVENGSQTEEIFECYKELGERCENFTVLTWNEGFNYSAINNFGAAKARGEYLLFLNNDTQMTDPDLIAELVGPCLRPEVGAVGARLFYEDGTIQHAGVIIGYGGIAGHAFQGMGGAENGYFSRIICQSDLSAVTAACMLVKRSAFEKAGGFDPVLAVAFNDIDLCLKLRREGYLIVYNPFAVMNHYESKSRGMEDTPGKIARFNKEADVLLRRWADILKNGDPYYNPNLSLDRVDFGLKKL